MGIRLLLLSALFLGTPAFSIFANFVLPECLKVLDVLGDPNLGPTEKGKAMDIVRAIAEPLIEKSGVIATFDVIVGRVVYFTKTREEADKLEFARVPAPLGYTPEYKTIFVTGGTAKEQEREFHRAFYNVRGYGGVEKKAGTFILFWENTYPLPVLPPQFGGTPIEVQRIDSREADRRRRQ